MTALLLNVSDRKAEARTPFVRLVEVDEDTTDPAVWGANWPKQYDTYKLTAQTTRTRFGGHGGSEALPEQKIDRDPWLKRMFLGYAFSLDYRDRRGHAYMLSDQENTARLSKPQSGSCLHCHASIMPLYRELGDGDAMLGFAASYKFTYQELNGKLHEMGHAQPVSCVDCHDSQTMKLRVTRPGFINGIQWRGNVNESQRREIQAAQNIGQVFMGTNLKCASCHDSQLGWTDGRTTSFGHGAKALARNAPSILNAAFQEHFFWDGRAASLEDQALAVFENGQEMATSGADVVQKLASSSGYRKMFLAAFGDEEPSLARALAAIATFERVQASDGSSAFDRFVKGDHDALDDG